MGHVGQELPFGPGQALRLLAGRLAGGRAYGYRKVTREDADAIVAYLRSLPAIQNKVPGPFGPSEAPTSFVMKVVPPAAATAKK